MENVQNELSDLIVEADSGGGMITGTRDNRRQLTRNKRNKGGRGEIANRNPTFNNGLKGG